MKEPHGTKVTLEKVAQAAGVSRATASRALTSSPRVSDDARKAVERAANRLGYVPNQAGRALATGRSDAVALVVFEPTTLLFGDPFFPRLIRGLGDVLVERDMQLMLLAPQTVSDVDRLERYVAAGHADGVLLVSLPGSHPLPGRLAGRGIPVVIGGRPSEPGRFSHVDVDNVAGAAHAVAHLIAGGRRAIATITGRQDVPAGQDRLRGYRQGLEGAGLPIDEGLVEAGDFTREGGIRAMRFLLLKRPKLDAVFVASDLMAAGALQVLAEAGRRVPEDVAVVGYDDDPLAAALQPPLSSVRQPIEEMGREMARLLLGIMQVPDQSPRKVLLTTRLEVRLSSAPASPRLTGGGV
ncbi:MAG TPA: LacI family DNA-binding transcriptional regulator [Candidatus Binatia bacterium]|nr:LacI family DNA-binding transcriptional regulator [Candidatus Binatia bacterium]